MSLQLSLDKWLPVKEIPTVDIRLATKEEVEREAKRLSDVAVALGCKTQAFYIRKEHIVVLTPYLKEEKFDRIVSVIDHEMLHHVLTTFVSGAVSHRMDNLIENKIRRVGLGNCFSIETWGKLDLERLNRCN